MEIVERNAAVRPVFYCEMGQEATVSEQGLDLVLRNQTETPLFIMTRTYESDGKTFAELTMIGEALGVKYALESASRETEMITEPVYVRDRDGRYATYSDQHVPVSEALEGYVSIVERVTLGKDGQEIGREMISENVYEAVPPMIYVGMTQREE
jgi:vancomycin resistance protein YoaR